MVDGTYCGRSRPQVKPLTDSDVRLLHEKAPTLGDRAAKDMETFRRRTPGLPTSNSNIGVTNGLIRAVAVPMTYQRRQALAHWTPTWLQWGVHVVDKGAWKGPSGVSQGVFNHGGSASEPTSDGFAFKHSTGFDDPQLLEFTEEGDLRFFNGRIAETRAGNDGDTRKLYLRALLGNVRCFVGVVGAAGTAMGFHGIWSLRLECFGLENAVIDVSANGWAASLPGDRYEEKVEASTDQLTAQPGQTTRELMGRLVRAMNSADADAVARDPFSDESS